MKKLIVMACVALSSLAYACGSNEYEQCVSACLIPRPFGGCAQEYKDCKCFPKIEGDVGKIGEKAKEAADVVKKEVEKLGQDTLTTIQKAGGDTVKTLERAAGNTVATLEKAGGDTVNTFVKTAKDATATYEKGWKDASEQTRRSFNDVVDAGKAVVNYAGNELRSYNSVINNAGKRLREGKVIDAMWGIAVEPMQGSEANFAKATQESTLIATAAASAAAVYGGPGGAAAYAAWSTYRATGDADLALRAGFLAAATSQAGASTSAMPSGTMGEVLKKSAMAGAAGGIAVAAAGGDEQAIKDGFLKSAGAVLVQAGNDKAKAFSPDAKDAWDTVQCLSARDLDCVSKTTWARDAKGKILTDANGKPRFDTTKIDPENYFGKWTGIDPASIEGKKNAVIARISQLPKVQSIPVMNNQWALTWTVGKDASMKYGKPTVVLTYVGPNPPFVSKVTYGRGFATPPWADGGPEASQKGNFDCILADIERTVRTTKTGNGCKAVYRRSGGLMDVLWHSDYFPDVCIGKSLEFVAMMATKGMQCKAS